MKAVASKAISSTSAYCAQLWLRTIGTPFGRALIQRSFIVASSQGIKEEQLGPVIGAAFANCF